MSLNEAIPISDSHSSIISEVFPKFEPLVFANVLGKQPHQILEIP